MELKPYLQLRDRLSQVWLNKNTIILVLMAVKLIIFSKQLQSSLDTAKYYTLNSCPTIDSVASTAVSIPHYLSKSANYMIQKSVQEINEKTVDTLDLMLTGTQNLIIFALEMIVGTYACVLVSTVDGAVDVAANTTESIITWVNTTLGDITDEIEDGLTDLSDVINNVIDAAETVKDLFTDDDDDDTTSSFNKVNLTVSALKNLQIPSSINEKLEELKASTPDFSTVKNKTEALISGPFDYIKKQIANASFITDNPGDDLFVPSLTNVQICSDNSDKIEEFYQDLANVIHKIMMILVIVLCLGALIAIIPVVIDEVRRWSKLKTVDDQLNYNAQQLEQKDPIGVFESTYNRIPTKAGMFASKLSNDPDSQTSIRWFMSYIFSSRSSIVLGLSLAGFIVIIAQFIMLTLLQHAIDDQDTPFDDISNELTNRVSESITNWTDSTNAYLEKQEDDINDELFSWIQTTTTSVNNTVSSFVDEMNEALADAFNGTILYSPVKAIVGCVIENKLIKVEEGLTWVHDNAEITLPRVTSAYLALALDDSSNSTTANSTVTNSTSTDLSQSQLMTKTTSLMSEAESMMSNVLQMIIDQYRKALMVEVWIAVALFGIWLTQAVIGGGVAFIGAKRAGDDEDTSESTINDEKFMPMSLPQIVDRRAIGEPRPLTRQEQKVYGFPYSDPFTTPMSTTELSLKSEQCPFGDENRVVSILPNWSSTETVQQQQYPHQEFYQHHPRPRQSSYYSTVHDSVYEGQDFGDDDEESASASIIGKYGERSPVKN